MLTLLVVLVMTHLPQESLTSSHIAPQQGPQVVDGLLGSLVGAWRFEVYVPGEDSVRARGTRTFVVGPDSTKLEWQETFAVTGARSTGMLGYDGAANAYYLIGVHGGVTGPTFLAGTRSPGAMHVRFVPVGVESGVTSANAHAAAWQLDVLGDDRHEWILDGGRLRVRFLRA